MKNHLISKNVAADIAEKVRAVRLHRRMISSFLSHLSQLCNTVKDKLIGTSASNFRGVAAVVRDALSEAMTRILTPRRRVDILRDVQEARKQHKPYVIVFCGVNGGFGVRINIQTMLCQRVLCLVSMCYALSNVPWRSFVVTAHPLKFVFATCRCWQVHQPLQDRFLVAKQQASCNDCSLRYISLRRS